MMRTRRRTLVGIALSGAFVAFGSPLDAQRRGTDVVASPDAARLAQQPAAPLVSITTKPDTFRAGAATPVTVAAVMTPELLKEQFRASLVRRTAGQPEQVLVEMTRSGRTLTATHSFTETAAGRVELRIRLQRTQPGTAAPAPFYSSPFFLTVQPAPAGPPFSRLSFAPEAIDAGTRTEIQITATISPALASAGVTTAVMRVTPGAPGQRLGELTRTGNTVTGRIALNEAAAGRVALRLVAVAAATFSAAAAAPPSSDVFSIVVRPRQTPPPVTPLEAQGLRATWPTGWSANRRVTDSGGPWSGNNFKSAYGRGGVIPTRGCEIEATSQPMPPGDLAAFIRSDTDPSVTITPTTVRAYSAFQTTYDEELGPGLSYRITAVYITARDRLFKVFLSRRVNDPEENACQDGLRQMLATFTPVG